MKILFLNFELGFGSGGETLVGHCGKFYGGPSIFNREHQCQSIVAEFANAHDYSEALKDIALTYSLFARKWVPFVVPSESTITSQTVIGADWTAITIQDATPEVIRNEFARRFPDEFHEPVEPLQQGSSLLSYKASASRILSLARKHAIDISDCKTNVERVDRINEALSKPVAA
jgi:hypothetical protein